MKFLSWILLLCFVSNAFASTGAVAELERALNDYQYNMVVDWDQKDKAQAEKFSYEFFARLDDLFQKDGLSNEDVMSYMETRIQDKKRLAELQGQVSMIANKANSSKELARLLSENAGAFESKGASWNGTTTLLAAGLFIAVAALLVHKIIFNLNHYCAEEKRYESCSMVAEQECGYPGGEYSCWNTGFTVESCHEATSCLKWEKR